MRRKNQFTKPDQPAPGITTTARPIDSLQGGSDKWATGVRNTIKLPTQCTTIGTWNVRTLYACGKLHELTHELKRYRWDVIGLSEVRWTSFGETTTDDGHKIWFSGEEKKHEYGVAFIVRKEIAGSVISCTPVSIRLITICISAKPHNLTIIQVYTTTTDHDDEETEEFYKQIDSIIATVPKRDMLIVQGDWNAKVGPDAYQNWAGTTGKFGIGETNDRGLRLQEFAKSHRLTLANTVHPHKLSRTTTWHSPNGQVHNQIDFNLTPQRYKYSVNKANTRTFPGADIGSDHDLVLAAFELKLKCKRCPRNPHIRFDLEKLKDPEITDVFQAQVGGKFAALNLMDTDVDTLANNIKEVLTTTAEQVVGKERKRIQPWVTNEVLDLCDKRRELRGKKHSSNEARTKHQQVNREVRMKMKAAKENWIEEQCEEGEKGMEAGNSKRAYNTLKTLTKTSQPRSAVIEDKDGKLLTDSEEVLNRWTEYCDGLCNYQLNPDSSILQDNPRSTDTANRTVW
ncbi:uncharacterized protein LOC143277357 [Babylonia areolata]|uniref:uncharacterized protein LOC143277357 n=1 Tax=Babylonia areolata TaxID=304850 RepID=UPI003FD058CC